MNKNLRRDGKRENERKSENMPTMSGIQLMRIFEGKAKREFVTKTVINKKKKNLNTCIRFLIVNARQIVIPPE